MKAHKRAKLTFVLKQGVASEAATRASEAKQHVFFKVFLPLGVLANLGLGIVILAELEPSSWSEWLQIGAGAFCCLVAGWLAAAAWSTSYWNRSMARQVAVWRRITDTFFAWVEDLPVPAESIHRLKSSLEEAVPGSQR